MVAPAAKVVIDEESFRSAERLLTRIPLELRTAILPKAIRAAARPVDIMATSLAPSSVRTGSRKKWSKKVRDKRAGTPQHKQTIGISSVRHYGETIAIYVGALWPAGVLINVIGHPHAEVWWGRRTGRTLPGTAYLEQAGVSTAAQQQAEFVGTVTREVEQILANGGTP